MKNIEEAISAYEEAEKNIGDFFSTEIWLGIMILLEDEWCEGYGEITFRNDGEVYAFEVYGTSKWEKDGYTFFTGEDNGEKSHYLFKIENKVDEIEY